MDPFCTRMVCDMVKYREGRIGDILCSCKVSRFNLFYIIISCSEQEQEKRIKGAGK